MGAPTWANKALGSKSFRIPQSPYSSMETMSHSTAVFNGIYVADTARTRSSSHRPQRPLAGGDSVSSSCCAPKHMARRMRVTSQPKAWGATWQVNRFMPGNFRATASRSGWSFVMFNRIKCSNDGKGCPNMGTISALRHDPFSQSVIKDAAWK